MCETRDLGIKWPQCHTLMVEAHVAVDMSEKDAPGANQVGPLDKVGSKA